MSADTLPFRLEVLQSGIRDVQTVLEAAREIPSALHEARNGAESAKWFIDDIDQRLARERILSAIGAVKNFLEKIERHQPVLDYCDRQRITVETTRWIEALSSVSNALRECGAKGLTLTRQLEELVDKLSPLEKRAVKFDQNFRDRVSKKVDELTDEILDMRVSLRRGDSSMDDLWASYFTSIEPKAQRLFVDYLDLLGGVSIRERALAMSALADVCQLDELCALADYHFTNELTMCVDLDTEITAVPGSSTPGDVPPWPILRLGLASWSIWGLPLTGHEFGKLVAEKRLNNEAGARAWQDELLMFGETGLRTLIGDTIGAWTEGPAYACALLFLVLNPAAEPGENVVNGRVTDAERAQVVLAVLDERAGPRTADGQRRQAVGYDYLPFLDLLRSTWVGNAKDGDETPDARESGVTKREEMLVSLPRLIIERLRLSKPFTLDDWERSQEVLKYLATEATPLPAKLAAGVRHLTNAAWRGRLSPKPDVETEELARRAMAEGLRLVNPERDRSRTVGTYPLKAGTAGP